MKILDPPLNHQIDICSVSTELFLFDRVSFQYGEEVILEDFSLKIDQGDVAAFKGESGSGKTTILKLLLGFEQPDSGEIRYKGEPMNTETVKQLRSESAWLPQDLNLGSGRVMDVVKFPLEFKNNSSRRFQKSDAELILNELGLDASVLEKNFRDLSTGQRQRIGLTICLLLDRPVLFLDEPTSALDAESVRKMTELLQNKSGLTIISTSHDPVWLEYCETVVELEVKSKK